jgi:hypothetical protein
MNLPETQWHLKKIAFLHPAPLKGGGEREEFLIGIVGMERGGYHFKAIAKVCVMACFKGAGVLATLHKVLMF